MVCMWTICVLQTTPKNVSSLLLISVGIALGYGLDDRGSGVLGFDSRRGLGIFLFTTASRTAVGPTQLPIQWVPGALSLGVKRPGREADHSPHLVPRSKNEWSCTSILQYTFMAWCSIKAQGQLYFYLLSNTVLYSKQPAVTTTCNHMHTMHTFPTGKVGSRNWIKYYIYDKQEPNCMRTLFRDPPNDAVFVQYGDKKITR
jgi:hypothetical protein